MLKHVHGYILTWCKGLTGKTLNGSGFAAEVTFIFAHALPQRAGAFVKTIPQSGDRRLKKREKERGRVGEERERERSGGERDVSIDVLRFRK